MPGSSLASFGAEWDPAKLQPHASRSVQEVRDGAIAPTACEGLVGGSSQGVNERGVNLVGGVQGRVREHLVNVRAVRLARIVREALPSVLVELGEVGLVLRVDDVNRVAREDDDVGNEVA